MTVKRPAPDCPICGAHSWVDGSHQVELSHHNKSLTVSDLVHSECTECGYELILPHPNSTKRCAHQRCTTGRKRIAHQLKDQGYPQKTGGLSTAHGSAHRLREKLFFQVRTRRSHAKRGNGQTTTDPGRFTGSIRYSGKATKTSRQPKIHLRVRCSTVKHPDRNEVTPTARVSWDRALTPNSRFAYPCC